MFNATLATLFWAHMFQRQPAGASFQISVTAAAHFSSLSLVTCLTVIATLRIYFSGTGILQSGHTGPAGRRARVLDGAALHFPLPVGFDVQLHASMVSEHVKQTKLRNGTSEPSVLQVVVTGSSPGQFKQLEVGLPPSSQSLTARILPQ